MWSFWLIIAGIFFVIEIATVGFLIFWLGIGALIAMVVSFFTNNLIIQTSSFIISSCILIPLTKPLAEKFLTKKTVPTNSYSLINKHGIVLQDIDSINSVGQVKVNGEIWSAKTEDDTLIKAGTEIEVIRIDGVKLIVSKIKDNVVIK